MQRFTTHYDGCENRTLMIPSETGAWVHIEDVQKIEKERDEARAEVERLRGLLKTVWEDACEQEAGFLDEVCDAVEAALKEGE